MADGNPNSKLVFALAAALGVALLVIAFLVGRESARIAQDDARPVGNALPPVSRLGVERNEDYAYADAHWGSIEGVHRRPDGTIVLSNTGNDDEVRSVSVDPPSIRPEATPGNPGDAVAEYFQQTALIRSTAGAGDPNTFAMDLIKAGMGGATSGFDRLISDTDRMMQELELVTPPPSCRLYHEASLESLEDAREMLEGMKVAITTRDIQSLGVIAQQAADLQAKAEALKHLQEEIRASAR
jgi:hypothetical protein